MGIGPRNSPSAEASTTHQRLRDRGRLAIAVTLNPPCPARRLAPKPHEVRSVIDTLVAGATALVMNILVFSLQLGIRMLIFETASEAPPPWIWLYRAKWHG